jgi:Leucine-rich repeat (LRR) protein
MIAKDWIFLSIKYVVDKCLELTELNLMRTNLPGKTINYLVNNLTPKITKLNLGRTYTNDEDVEILVSRCNKLVELDLSRTQITSHSVRSISEHLKSSLEFLSISFNQIHIAYLFPLTSMTQLKFLDCDFQSEDEEKTMKISLPSMSINEKIGYIGSPMEIYEPQDGLWEIKMGEIKLFQDTEMKPKSSSSKSITKLPKKRRKLRNLFF